MTRFHVSGNTPQGVSRKSYMKTYHMTHMTPSLPRIPAFKPVRPPPPIQSTSLPASPAANIPHNTKGGYNISFGNTGFNEADYG